MPYPELPEDLAADILSRFAAVWEEHIPNIGSACLCRSCEAADLTRRIRESVRNEAKLARDTLKDATGGR